MTEIDFDIQYLRETKRLLNRALKGIMLFERALMKRAKLTREEWAATKQRQRTLKAGVLSDLNARADARGEELIP